MSYKIDQIEGVGESYATKLNAAGISTVEALLEAGKTKKGRDEIAAKTGIADGHILKWVNHADLFRIKGIAGQFAELLEAAGVDTVKEFRNRVPANLHEKLVSTNEAKNICNRVPSLSELTDMIEQAKTLEPTVTH